MSDEELTLEDAIGIARIAEASFMWPAGVQITHIQVNPPAPCRGSARLDVRFGYRLQGSRWPMLRARIYDEAKINLAQQCHKRDRTFELVDLDAEAGLLDGFIEETWTEIDG